MTDDEGEPVRRKPRLETPVLDPMSVSELNAYIADLTAEIHRTEAAIARKQDHRSAADAFFRKPN